MANKKPTFEKYDPFKGLDDTSLKNKGDIHRFTREEVLQDMIYKYLSGGQKAPDKFAGVVRSVIKYDDPVFSNVDPFHSATDDKERMLGGDGTIFDFKNKVVAYVEVPSFFTPIGNMITCKPGVDSVMSLLRVDITSAGKDGARWPQLHEIILLSFDKKSSFYGAKFAGYPKKNPVVFQQNVENKKEKTAKVAFNKGKKKERCPA
jgi:hypothetical protein